RRRRCSRCGDMSATTSTRAVATSRRSRVATRADLDALLADVAAETRGRFIATGPIWITTPDGRTRRATAEDLARLGVTIPPHQSTQTGTRARRAQRGGSRR